MAFRDQILRCAATGKSFVWTVAEQRERVRNGLSLDPPLYCPEVRASDVRLAGDTNAAFDDDEVTEAPHEPVAAGDDVVVATASNDEGASSATDERAAEIPNAPDRRREGGREGRGGGRASGRTGGGRGPRGNRADGGGDTPPQSDLRIRHIGTVKWFDAERGFGFVVHEEGGELFLHGSSLIGDSIAALREGTPVEYEVVDTTRGRRAVDVVPLA